MRLRLVVAAVAAVFLPAVAHAAVNVRACSGIALVSPAEGAHFLGSRPIHFKWSGEPAGTVSRDLHLAGLDGSETVIPLDGRFSDTVKVRMSGDLAWVVVFKDGNGKPLCVSPAGLLAKGPGGGKVVNDMASLSGQSAGAVPVAIFMRNGRLVIVLQNSPYTGEYSRRIAADNYDGSSENLMGAAGLEIHGNASGNIIYGSTGPDLIYAYAGADFVSPGLGQDVVDLGTSPAGNTDEIQSADGEADQIFVNPSVQISGPSSIAPGETTNFDFGLDSIN